MKARQHDGVVCVKTRPSEKRKCPDWLSSRVSVPLRADARETLRQWREENDRRSEETVELWHSVIAKNIKKLGDEKWVVYEQVCIAALDCHEMALAKECLNKLDEEFPGSLRVKKLEALEKYDEAFEQYDALLAQDEANSAVHKRRVAVLLSQQMVGEAVRELSDYLRRFMGDQEAWLQLCGLYLREQDLARAAFCLEELILCNPHNHLYYQRYAEIQYTIGNMETMELARSYFAQAVKLNPNNIRALYGLFLAASHIGSHPKSSVQKKKDNQRYAAWASQQITKKYQERQCEDSQVKLLEGMLTTLQIN
ncbi:ER membrane protein complex subunit 2-A-like isoform X2 [Dermacentor andersoni]|uniref:ER membrane protein complex subunit 2-A-like isoform X2 n=1 Tax=Dermacentor andersoni TaxID=34620 RepID=UPI002155F715|nr:ER membrane protein complex subunit 2-A-like isoform X2 [Dermacentor andersoni]